MTLALMACRKCRWPLVLCTRCGNHWVCPRCIAEDGDKPHDSQEQ